jgi:hypothetical protein
MFVSFQRNKKINIPILDFLCHQCRAFSGERRSFFQNKLTVYLELKKNSENKDSNGFEMP